MANKKFWLGILVISLLFGMTIIGCDNGTTDNSNGSGDGGIFTLNNIPSEYNGKYARLYGDNGSVTLFGAKDINFQQNTGTSVIISNELVNLPMWILSGSVVIRYSGNDTVEVAVGIFNTSTMDDNDDLITIDFIPVTFSNGNAIKSWTERIY